jgi:hypothetical protein
MRMAEKWAQKCAKLEKGSSGFAYEAAQEYAAKHADGWSHKAIAAEVEAAGFPIHRETVRRRIEALARVEGSPSGSVEADFAAAYTQILEEHRPHHGSAASAPMPQNEEGVAMVLEKAAKVLQDKYEWTEAEVKQEIAAAKVKSKAASVEAAPAPRITRYDLMVEFLDTIRSEFGDKPFTQREQTKAEEISLELQIRIGAEVR